MRSIFLCLSLTSKPGLADVAVQQYLSDHKLVDIYCVPLICSNFLYLLLTLSLKTPCSVPLEF